MMARSTRSNQRPDTLMQDRICQVDETSCNARLDHTSGSISSFRTGVPDFRSTLNNGPWRNPPASSFGAKMGSRAYWQIDGESVIQKTAPAGQWSHNSLRHEPWQQHDLAAEPASIDTRVDIFR